MNEDTMGDAMMSGCSAFYFEFPGFSKCWFERAVDKTAFGCVRISQVEMITDEARILSDLEPDVKMRVSQTHFPSIF